MALQVKFGTKEIALEARLVKAMGHGEGGH